MKLTLIFRTLILTIIVVVGLWIIRYLTAFILVFEIYGESQAGSEKAYNVYRLFPVRHLPIIIPLTLLTYQTFRFRLWKKDQAKFKSNVLVGLLGLVTYILIEALDVLGSF